MLKGFRKWLFLSAVLFYLILIIKPYFLNLALDNGRDISQTGHVIAGFFIVLRYPFLFRGELSLPIVLLALVMNCFCYGFVIERIMFLLFYRLKMK